MLYLGIDVGKQWHDAALLDEQNTVLWRLRFAATRAGFAELAAQLGDLSPADVVIGLEATGSYWLTVHAWLARWQAGTAGAITVLNPLQTRAFRNANLRGNKTDRIDAVAIARLLRWSGATLSAHTRPDDRQAAAREISRVHTEMIELRARQLVQLHAVLDRTFPEFATAFADLGSLSALAVLARWPTPATLAAARLSTITRVLHEASRGHLGEAKAETLRTLARESVGVSDPHDAATIAIRAMIGHLDHLAEQVRALGMQLDALLAAEPETQALLASIPGLGRESVRTWLAEAPPIDYFAGKDGAERLVAHVGLDAQLKQSGRSAGKVRMSKRGNRYLRRAIMLAAESAARTDPQCRTILEKQRAKGKHYRVAVSHVARKLLHIIYGVLTHQRPYMLPAAYLTPAPSIAEIGA
jgi:transposase